jgi:hypothetical protein
MLDLQNHTVDAKAVATVSTAYQDAMDEIVRGSGYLPSKSHRGMIAAKMIVSADAGEGDVNRLKETGLHALRDDLPLSLAFAARLRST